jgi:hypothetical protein
MSKNQTYTQCTYTQPASTTDTNAVRVGVAWIPSQFAEVGRKIRIDGKLGVWTVTGVGSTKSAEHAIADSRDYLNMRKVSDIPKQPKRKLGHMEY